MRGGTVRQDVHGRSTAAGAAGPARATFLSPPPPLAPRPQAPRQPSDRQPPARQPTHHAVAWSLLGFFAGIVFWHFVGFWSFVSAVVFNSGPVTAAAPQSSDAGDRRKLQTTLYGGIPSEVVSNAAACSTLRLDRNTGRTTISPCDTPDAQAAAALARRWSFTLPPPERAPDVAGWSATLGDEAGRD